MPTSYQNDPGIYGHGEIGNLVADKSEGILEIEWTVYGKVRRVVKNDRSEVIYHYDPSGNRTMKRVKSPKLLGEKQTYYYRDASGNMMQTLNIRRERGSDTTFFKKEYPIYGSSRVGMYWVNDYLASDRMESEKGAKDGELLLGSRSYELANQSKATPAGQRIGRHH